MKLNRTDLYLFLGGIGGIVLTLALPLYFAGAYPGGWAWELVANSDRVFDRATTFFVAIRDERYTDAHELMEPSYREHVSVAEFRTLVESHSLLTNVDGAGLGSFADHGNSAVLSGTLSTKTRTVAAEVHMVEIDGKYYIHEIVLGGRPTLMPPPDAKPR